jgi:hypothetical protein
MLNKNNFFIQLRFLGLTRHSRPRQPHSRAGCGGNPAKKARKAVKTKVISHFVALFDHMDNGLRRYDVFFC